MANVDEWKWKLSMLLRNEQEQEIVSRDKRDRRDFEQISNLAKRMGLYWYDKAIFHGQCIIILICLLIEMSILMRGSVLYC